MTWKIGCFTLLLSFLLLTPPVAVAIDETPGYAIIQKPFMMYAGAKKNPYTLYYPIELTEPGEISIYIKTYKFDPPLRNKKFAPLRAVLVDARAFNMTPAQWKQWAQKANQYNPLELLAGDQIRAFATGVKHLFGGKQKPPVYFHKQMACGRNNKFGSSLKYAVDAPELAKTGGHYVLIVRNIASFKVEGSLLIRYPGRTWEYDPAVELYAKVHPDLMIKSISLTKKNQVQIKIENQGQGSIMLGQYHRHGANTITLLIKVGGRSYGATLPLFDPERKLRKAGATVTYTLERAIINKPTDVTATIDSGKKLLESNEKNNSLTQKIGGVTMVGKIKPLHTVLPDLMIKKISLNNQGQVTISIKNQGTSGLKKTLWSQPQNAPLLEIKVNGSPLSTISLFGFDPGKMLSKTGGVVTYNTGFVPEGRLVVSATIDSLDRIKESNEQNNKKRVSLRH
ncbi:MAG: hypothetical protein L3J57_10205 [Desulfuromusa sp.]|nr:hypothetical protein [Desulfuromusa sp.]